MLAGRLLRALALRNNITKASPVVTASIPGKNNIRADNASRWFDSLFNKKDLKLTDKNFLNHFNRVHSLQTGNWAEFTLSSDLISRVISELLGKRSTLASWTRLPKIGGSIGRLGVNMHIHATPALTWIGRTMTQSSSSQDLRQEFDRDFTAGERELAFRASQTRWAPSQRQSKWEEV